MSSANPPRFIRRIPEGDDRERLTCPDCGHVAYENPKIVVGSVVDLDGGVLLCRRAIEPRRGFWTLPAGYMEMQETVEEGAAREAWEEARARLTLEGVLAVYSIARLGQVQVIFRARLAKPGFAAGPESLEVRRFDWDEIPWDALAFPSVHWALKAWREGMGAPLGAPAGNPGSDPRGATPLPQGGRVMSKGTGARWAAWMLALALAPACAMVPAQAQAPSPRPAARPSGPPYPVGTAGQADTPNAPRAAEPRRRGPARPAARNRAAPLPPPPPPAPWDRSALPGLPGEPAPVPNHSLDLPAISAPPRVRLTPSLIGPHATPDGAVATGPGHIAQREERLYTEPAAGATLRLPFSY